LTRLPEPFLPLQDSVIKYLDRPHGSNDTKEVLRVFAEVGNEMGTARRCNLAKLFLTLQIRQPGVRELAESNPEGVQILIRVSDSLLFH